MANAPTPVPASEPLACFHCGEPCTDRDLVIDDKAFCCVGCKTVYELLSASDLDRYYRIEGEAGIKPSNTDESHLAYLDDDAVISQMLDFREQSQAVITFKLPSIHCIACVWLLENLHRLHPAVSRSQVHFPRQEAIIHFDIDALSLRELVAMLTRLGYEPQIRLDSLGPGQDQKGNRQLYTKLGLAGFAFANVMLFSFPGYLGLGAIENPRLPMVFGWLSVALSIPVLLYADTDYLRAAWLALRQRTITIDLPISLGIVALFTCSLYEIATGTGAGYLDSFTGLIFFLLIGRVFQQKTYDYLSFDRDYTSYFPVHVIRLVKGEETSIPLTRLKVGDRIIVRNLELIPADAILISPEASIDYAFVTGESEPVHKTQGELVYAGGRQVGPSAVFDITKPVSQSHLTRLWDNPVFHENRHTGLDDLTNRVSRYFTVAVVLLAVGAATYHASSGLEVSLRVFTSVLIVACPCALALAAPFALGTLLRIMARRQCYVRNTSIIEAMARLDTIVFDKTGTLTRGESAAVETHGALTAEQQSRIYALCRHSTHPLSMRLASALRSDAQLLAATDYEEHPGQGLAGEIDGHALRIGSADWTGHTPLAEASGSVVYVSEDGQPVGAFTIMPVFRPGLSEAMPDLRKKAQILLLSGDSDHQATALKALIGDDVAMHFQQSPEDKLGHIQRLRADHHRVMMVGDGLNDAGALRQSDVGVAVTDDLSAFSPACDVIVAGEQIQYLSDHLQLARKGMLVVTSCFVISFTYNIVGLYFATRGALSPLVSAILMPLSSFTVMSAAIAGTHLMARLQKSKEKCS